MNDYHPISCALHSRYELAVLRRERLRLRWLGEDGAERQAELLPTDVQTRAGAEYLQARDAAGAEVCIRLDWILAAETPAGMPL